MLPPFRKACWPGLLSLLAAADARAQDTCGASGDCPPFFYGFPVLEEVSSEIGPTNYFRVGEGASKDCAPLQGRLLGMVYGLHSSAFVLATDEPGLEVLFRGDDSTTSFPIAGTQMRCAGGSYAYVKSYDGTVLLREEAFGITERAIGLLHRDVIGPLRLDQFFFPAWATPRHAALVGTCQTSLPSTLAKLELATLLTDDSLHVVSEGFDSVFQFPAHIVDAPWSATTGTDAYVIAFSANAAHALHEGGISAIALIGSYVSSRRVQGRIVVTTSAGEQVLPTPGRKVRFGDCSADWEMNPCSLGGRLGINLPRQCGRSTPRWAKVKLDAAESIWGTSVFGRQ